MTSSDGDIGGCWFSGKFFSVKSLIGRTLRRIMARNRGKDQKMKKTMVATALSVALTTSSALAEGPEPQMNQEQIANEILSTQSAEGSFSPVFIMLLLAVVIAMAASTGGHHHPS